MRRLLAGSVAGFATAAVALVGCVPSPGGPGPAPTSTTSTLFPTATATAIETAAATPAPAPAVTASATPSTQVIPTAQPTAAATTTAPPPYSVPTGVDGFASVGTPTTGGTGGQTVTVSTAADLTRYASTAGKYVIRISGTISTTGQIRVSSDKTIEGASRGAGLTGGGLSIRDVSNVVVRNLTISKAVGTDAISVYNSHHVWITQNDLSSDMTHDKDYYDGLIDITKGSDYVTVSYNYLHDHFKVMLIGASDDDTVDRGKSRVTIHHNHFRTVNSRLPSLRFGTGHIYNNVFSSADTGVNSRMGAVVLLEGNVFGAVSKPVITTGYSDSDGRAVLSTDFPNDFGGVTPAGTPGPSSSVSLPYTYSVVPAATAATSVPSSAGPR